MRIRPVTLTLLISWVIKPFTRYAIASLFLGLLFRELIGTEALDLVKTQLGLDLEVGAGHAVRLDMSVDLTHEPLHQQDPTRTVETPTLQITTRQGLP